MTNSSQDRPLTNEEQFRMLFRRTAVHSGRLSDLTTVVRRIADAMPTPTDAATTTPDLQATPDDLLYARVAAALTAEHYRRADARIVASPEDHCAAFADVVMSVIAEQQAGGLTGIRGLLEFVGVDTAGRDITVEERIVSPASDHPAPRLTADTINDDQLDALVDERDDLAEELARIRRALGPDDEVYIRETVDDQLRLTRQNEQLRAGRATWLAKAEEIERDRDRLAEELIRWKALLQKSRQMTSRHWEAITRVRSLAERWRYTGDRKEGPLRELRAALDGPSSPVTTPDDTPRCVPGPYADCPNCPHEDETDQPKEHWPMADQQPTTVSYFIQSRPAAGQPWQLHGIRFSWESKAKALEKLATRREMQSGWEHRLMERITTVTEQPATEA